LNFEQGPAEAVWYQSPVPRESMRRLLERRNGPGLRDVILWFGLLALFGYLGYRWWGNWYAVFPFMAYGVLYGSTSDSRWQQLPGHTPGSGRRRVLSMRTASHDPGRAGDAG